MIFYYLFLLLSPFEEHPKLGVRLFYLGFVPITPIKLAGLFVLAAAFFLPRPGNAAPRLRTALPWVYAIYGLWPLSGTLARLLPFPQSTMSAFISYGLLFAATRPLICTENRLRNSVRAMVFAQTFASTWLYRQYYFYGWLRPIGPASDPNYEALSLVMSIPLAMWLVRFERNRFWKFMGYICLPTLVFAIPVSQSRGAMLALGVVIFFAWLNSRHKAWFIRRAILVAVLAIPFTPKRIWQRFAQIQVSGQAQSGAAVSTRVRVELIKAGLRMAKDHPFFGVGLEQFKQVVDKYNPELHEVINKNYVAHNTYVQEVGEGGFPTLALYLFMLYLTMMNFRVAEHARPPDIERWDELGKAMRLGFTGFMVASFFLSAQLVKLLWTFVSLSPNVREIALAAAGREATRIGAPPAGGPPRNGRAQFQRRAA